MGVVIIQGENEKNKGIHYEVDPSMAPVGAGGMGQVLRGTLVDEHSGVRRDAAIKFLFDDLPASAIDRSRREASVQLRNDNLVEMFGFVEVSSVDAAGNPTTRYHVASEFLDGVMLHDLIHGRVTNAEGKVIPFAEELLRQYRDERLRFTVFIIRNLLSGIMALHDAGFIHRDIDPSNIMITADGKVKLIDFGICKNLNELGAEDRHLTTAGQFMGKAAYAAPELVTGDVRHQDATTDLYSVGIMMFELLAGELPFDGPTHEVLEKQLKEAIPVKKIENKYARKVILKATAKKQAERYGSAAEFRVAVEQLSRNSVAGASKPSEGGAGGGGNDDGGIKGVISNLDSISIPSVKDLKKNLGNIDELVKKNKKQAIIAAGIVAVIIVGAIIIGVVNSNKAESEKLLAEQEAARLEAIELRKAELQDVIVDSEEPRIEIDSLTGIEIPTAGYLISTALTDLQDSATVARGLETLEKVAAKGMKSSATALSMLASLHVRSTALDSAVSAATDQHFQRDYAKANELNQKALELNPKCYYALYELGCDYLAGSARGVVDRDLDKAKTLLVDGLREARESNDTVYISRFIDRLSLFGDVQLDMSPDRTADADVAKTSEDDAPESTSSV